MGGIINRPRAVTRQALTEPTNRVYLSSDRLAMIDEILAKDDASWSPMEWHFLNHSFGMIGESCSD